MARLPVEKVKIDLPITTENWWFSLLGFMFIGGLLLFTNWNRPTLSQPRLPTGFLCFYREDRFRGFSIAGDRLWAGGRDGLVLIDWKMGKVISLPSGTPDLKNIESVAVDSSGTIWVGYDSGLSAFQGGIWKDMSEGLPSPKVMSVFPTASGEVWVGTDKGTGRFVAGTWKPFEEQEKLSNSMVRVVFVDSRGGLWFGSYAAPAGGLSYFDGSEWHYYSTQNGLPHNNIVAVGEDRQGTIWVGSG